MIRETIRRYRSAGFAAALAIALLAGMFAPACGTIRTHAGIEHDYRYDFDDYGYHKKHHKHHKHHKKHHKHHHHDD